MTLQVPNLRDGYVEVVRYVAELGQPSSPRGRETREVLGATVIVQDPTDCLPMGVGRKVNAQIAAVEACQLVAGRGRPDLVVASSENFSRYQEDDGSFHGNYGNRIGLQLVEACQKLQADPDTRQAVISLWDAQLDNLSGKRDYPCTVALQLLIRDDRLVLMTLMRSNDAWLGLAYDAFQFTQLQLTAARILGVEPGVYVHRANSLHVYQDDLDAGLVDRLRVSGEPKPGDLPTGFGIRSGSPERTVNRARAVLQGISVPMESQSEAWYRQVLAPLRSRV